MIQRPPRAFWLMCFWGWAALGNFDLMLPLLGLALHAGPATIGVLFSVFSITSLGLRVGLGPLLDRIDRRPVLLGGLVIYVVALALFAVATTVPMVVVARLLQGLGSTAVWLTATVVLSEWSGNAQASAFGRYQMISVWGAAIGTLWTGAVTVTYDQSIRTLLSQWITLPHWFPAPLAQLALLQLIFAGNAVCACLALIAALRLTRLPTVAPAERLRWNVPPALRPLIAVAGLSGAASGLLVPVQVVLLEQRFGKGLLGIAIAYTVPGIVYGLAPAPLGRWSDRRGYRWAAIIGLLLPVVCYLALPWTTAIWGFAALLCLEALGLSLATPALYALVAASSSERRGSGYGAYTFAGGLAGAIAQGIGGWLYSHFGPATPFVLASGLLVVSALLCAQFSDGVAVPQAQAAQTTQA